MSTVATSSRWVLDKLGLLALIIVILVAATVFREMKGQVESGEGTIFALEKTRDDILANLKKAEEQYNEIKRRLEHHLAELDDAEEFASQARTSEKNCLDELAECGLICQLRDYKEYKRKEAECIVKGTMADSLERDVEKIRNSPIFEAYNQQKQRVAQIKSQLTAQEGLIREWRERLESTLAYRILETVRDVLPLAITILIGVLAMPLVIRSIFYYLLAPPATRLPPITVLPADDPPHPEQRDESAVSIKIALSPDEELIVQPTFIQRLGHSSGAKTQLFLNMSLPFASIASGMFLLTRIRSNNEKTNEVVVSATRDPLAEVGVIELPAGSAMVVQPRCLAGVVKPIGKPVQISRHWRLRSLHAWLTLQLRYLVFHGPCRLIIKGCRGFLMEVPGAEASEKIRQSATIGWSASLGYKTIRCETFMPYLRGEEELFSDMFLGQTGKFVYEQMPNWGRRKGALSRGLEGVVDAFLKAFGI